MIYSNIKKICNQNNISIMQLEKELGFPKSSICKWDKNIPNVFKIGQVAKYFGITIEKLLEESMET